MQTMSTKSITDTKIKRNPNTLKKVITSKKGESKKIKKEQTKLQKQSENS